MATWIIETINSLGYVGIFLLMLLESVFPPIPSELIIPFAGYSAATGTLNLWLVLLTATAGAVVGMLPWYFAGRLFGLNRVRYLADRYGRWLTLNAEEIDTATSWFHRYGPTIVFVGRLIPLIRTLISVPGRPRGDAALAVPAVFDAGRAAVELHPRRRRLSARRALRRGRGVPRSRHHDRSRPLRALLRLPPDHLAPDRRQVLSRTKNRPGHVTPAGQAGRLVVVIIAIRWRQ